MERAAAAAAVRPGRGSGVRALSTGIVLAVVVMAGALVLRGLDMVAGASPAATELLPLLFTAAGLCTAGLLRRRSPAGAWLTTVAAAGIAAIEVGSVVRSWQPHTSLETWPWLVLTADIALLLAAVLAGTYAVRSGSDGAARSRGGRGMAWRLIVLAGLASVVVAAGWAIAASFTGLALAPAANASGVDLWPLRASGRIAIGFVALATLGGALRDFAGPARRAWTRAPNAREFPRALGDELLPAAAAIRRRGEEDERARLAAELHARVLPDLRRVADAAAAGGATSDPVAVGLRHAVEDIEQLMHARQSVVLEEFGLVAALEWLAERTEQRGGLQVDIELDGADADAGDSAIPRPVARAAFRVALLALDNAVRHAGATRAVMRLQVADGQLRLAVTDDGRGIDTALDRRGGRGLPDMRTAAAEVGATVKVARLAIGTRVEISWLPGEDHATTTRDLTAGLSAPAD